MSYRTREVACPTCGAGIGDVCRDGQGDEVQPHTTRIRLASGDTTEQRLEALRNDVTIQHDTCCYLSRELSVACTRIRDLEGSLRQAEDRISRLERLMTRRETQHKSVEQEK